MTESWWKESTPSLPRSARLSSLSVLSGSCTSEIGEVVYSQAENKTNISTKILFN